MIFGIHDRTFSVNFEKGQKYLESLGNTEASDILDDWLINKGDGNSFEDFLYNYSSDCIYGVCAVVKDIILSIEEIELNSDNSDGYGYILGLYPDAPWKFDEKIRSMSEDDFKNLIKKYLINFTDDKIQFDWYETQDTDW